MNKLLPCLLILCLLPVTTFGATCSNIDGTVASSGTLCDCGTTTCSTTPTGPAQLGPTPGMYCTASSNRCDEAPPCPLSGFADAAGTFALAFPGYAIHTQLTIADHGAGSPGVVITGSPNGAGKLPVLSGGGQNQILMVKGKLTISWVRITRGRTALGACDEWGKHPTWSTTKCAPNGIDPGTGNCYQDVYDGGFERCVGLNDSFYVGLEADEGPWPTRSGGLVYLGDGVLPWEGNEWGDNLNSYARILQDANEYNNAPTNIQNAYAGVVAAAKRRILTANNVIFEFGSAQQAGGGVMVANGYLICNSCTVRKNEGGWSAGGSGGGIYIANGFQVFHGLDVTNTTVEANGAMYGGGIYVKGEIRHFLMDNSVFSGNSAESSAKEGYFHFGSRVWPYNVFRDPITNVLWDTNNCEGQSIGLYRHDQNDCSCSNDGGCLGTGFKQCPAGTYVELTFTSTWDKPMLGCPVLCAAGTYSGEGTAPRVGGCANVCEVGAYCPSGSVLPITCPGGKYGTTTRQHLVTSCVNCLAGYYSDGEAAVGACTTCPAGYAQPNSQMSYCLPCIPGKYQDQNTGAIVACKSCTPGKNTGAISAASCDDCVVGKYTTQNSQSSCITCIPGSYQKEQGKQLCNDCIGGTMQDLSGQPNCKNCELGKYAENNGQTGCKQCSVGQYNNAAGKSTCKECTAGTFQSNTGQTICETCFAGQYNSNAGGTGCLDCPLARHSREAGANVCTVCPDSKYQDLEGRVSCKTCVEAGQTANDAQTTCIDPTYTIKSDCKDTEYLDNTDPDRDHHVCRLCPAGCSCIGWLDWSEVVGMFGWARCPARSGNAKGNDTTTVAKTKFMQGKSSMVLVAKPEAFERCSFSAACLGRENKDIERKFILSPDLPRTERCNFGYVNNSRLCYSCESGYSHAGDLSGRCSKCPPKAENIGVGITAGIFGFVGVLGYLYITLSDGGSTDSKDSFKMIGLNFVQLLSLLSTFPIEWPPIFTAIFQVGGAITALGQHFVNLKCLYPQYTDAEVFYSVVLIWAVMPFALNAVICLAWLVAKEMFPKKVRNVWQNMKSCVVALCYLLYPTLCAQTFSIFACRSVCPGSSDASDYLRADLEEQCGIGRHLAFSLLLGVPMFICFVLGLPLVGLYTVWRIRRAARNAKHGRTSMHLQIKSFRVYGMLFSMFREDQWYWESTLATRKVVFAAIGVFGGNLGQFQVHLTSMFLMFVILATAIVRPFELGKYGKMLQLLELSSLMAVWLTLWSGLVFFSYPRCEAYYGAARNDEDESSDGYRPGQTLVWCDALSVITGIMDVCVVIAVVVALLYTMKEKKKEKDIQATINKGHGGRYSNFNMAALAGIAKSTQEFAIDLEKRTHSSREFDLEKRHSRIISEVHEASQRRLQVEQKSTGALHAHRQTTYQYVMEHAKLMEHKKKELKIDAIINTEHEHETLMQEHLNLKQEMTHNKIEVRKLKVKVAKERSKSSLYVHAESEAHEEKE